MSKSEAEREGWLKRLCEKAANDGYYTYYPDQPFKYGYSIYTNKNPYMTDKVECRGPLSDCEEKRLSQFVSRPWPKDRKIRLASNAGFVDIVATATIYEEEVEGFMRRLKNRLRRCCNIQNPDALTWKEIFAAIDEYMSSEQGKGGQGGGKADLPSSIHAKIWAMLCKLYEITLRVTIDAILDRIWPKAE